MSVSAIARARRRRRLITYLWIGALSVLTISLIYWEQTALLYILATLGVTLVLVIVAMADLAHSETMSSQSSAPERPGSSGTASRRS